MYSTLSLKAADFEWSGKLEFEKFNIQKTWNQFKIRITTNYNKS